MKKINLLAIACVAALCCTTMINAGDTCEGDVDGDGVVGILDILAVISGFGECDPKSDCPADLDGSGVVDIQDLLTVLINYGPCDGIPQCESDEDCDDGDPCTFDICLQGVCYNFPIPNCE